MKNKILAIFLICSLALNVLAGIYVVRQNHGTEVYGTFRMGDEKLPDCKYMVFEKDGSYMCYEQFNVLETGTYSIDDLGIVSVFNDNGDLRSQMAFDGESKLYVYEQTIGIYEKIDDMPMYINVEGRI